MRLTIARHGETIENRDRIIQGQNPGQLTELGHQQAQELAKELHGYSFDAIYCSDLQRCIDTAKPTRISHPDTPVYYSDKLREISFGEYQGKPSTSLNWQALEGTALSRKAPGGESWTDLTHRVIPFINKIYRTHLAENVLVVTRGGPMRVIRAAIGGLVLEDLITDQIPNCEVWNFEVEMELDEDAPILHSHPTEV